MRIRNRLIIVVVSLFVAALTVVGVLSNVAARGGMTRLAMHYLATKANEIEKYAVQQWDALLTNGLTTQALFVEAAQQAVTSYALTMVQEEGEIIFGFDHAGAVVFVAMSDGGAPRFDEPRRAERWVPLIEHRNLGWLRIEDAGEELVVYSFDFAPFGWRIVVGAPSAVFFAEVYQMRRYTIVVLAVVLSVGTIVLLLVAGSLTKPISALVEGLHAVASGHEFDRRIALDGDDEIGTAARAFNAMAQDLGRSYNRLREVAFSEAKARVEVHERELEALMVLGRAAEYKDQDTGLHLLRVGMYTVLIAEAFGMREQQRRILYQAAPLHDLGKIGIPDAVLLKPGALSPVERLIMEEHTIIGHTILRNSQSPSLRAGAIIALSHHEKFDGTGYPRKLSGRRIPLFSRILAVADVFDALTSERPYKNAWSFEDAFALIERERGRHFDPHVADLFLSNQARVREIYATPASVDALA